ncbi:DNA polymerase delta catalytic subunit [Durusdinium trenchii]|uniref:DNA polymerase n=1 Tax=Durusdinium trenchii TaxID=1381693 RepID=A0ABP0JGF6_9DINO
MKRVSAPASGDLSSAEETVAVEDPVVIKRAKMEEAAAGGKGPKTKKDKVKGEFEKALEAQDAGQTQRESLKRKELPLQGVDEGAFDVVMQWVDMDMYSAAPLAHHPVQGEQVPGLRSGEVPIIRIFGVSREGHSVMAHVYGVTPYFYCDCPGDSFTEEDLPRFRAALDDRVKSAARTEECCVVGVLIREKMSIMGWCDGKKKRYLQVMVSVPTMVPKARNILENGFKCPRFSDAAYTTYESNVPFILRYMVDNNIVGGNWLEIPRARYKLRRPGTRMSRCQVELDVVFEDIVSHSPNVPQWSKMAPLRILSFDIECMGRRGSFPDPTKDPVIQIATYLSVQGEAHPITKVVMVLGTCLPIVGAEVRSFERETDLLLAWSQFVRDADPDILTGYNIQNFDFPYLMDRAKTLRVGNKFAQLSKLLDKESRISNKTFSSAAYGTRENKELEVEGRVVMDMIVYMYRNHQLSSYSLNAVSSEFLGQQKEDVHHSIISDLQRGTDEDRRRLAVYCLKDAFLPLQLMDKLMVVINYVEMARVTGVPIPFLFSRGQQIKVMSMIYRKGLEHDLIVPVFKRAGGTQDGVMYEGATVIDPKKGFYDEPIATLDFASLYPSIMMAHNLCYTTLMDVNDAKGLKEGEDYTKTPAGNLFVTPAKQKGILPIILEELLGARKRAKKDMKAATDPFEKAVMNGRQLALKVSANSVYGFTGAVNGSLPCIQISGSVTAFGRDMINATQKKVEELYSVKNGYAADAEVVYGDTDSVMVKFGVKTVKEAMALGLEAAEVVTKELFKKPIALEFEKVYYPFLLMNKKRYAGMFWTRPEKYDKMDAKGIETVRRDTCELVRTMIDTILRKILIDHSVSAAVQYTKDTIAALLQNKVDMSLLIITKSLSGKSEDYTNKQPHVELAKRMRARDPGSAPVIGDRVPYVMIQMGKDEPAWKRSEDPIYVLENNIAIDFRYYLDKKLGKPLIRIFQAVLPNPESLLNGDHTLSVYKATPSNSTGIMKFAVRQDKCLACNMPINQGAGLCSNCEKNRQSLYLDKLSESNSLEDRFSRLWTQCQRCQGSMHQDVLCTSRDCPIFYMRKKVQKDLAEVNDKLARLSEF